MALIALRDDALSSTPEGFTLRLALPWIRSMPLASVHELSLTLDGTAVTQLRVNFGGREVEAAALAEETGWWFLQDRLLLTGPGLLTAGEHSVSVAFRLLVPYLEGPGGAALMIPYVLGRSLTLDAPSPTPTVSRDVA
ncbi:DUF6379 domain-containing protein [Salinibacterium sp. SYSU T00001]|uniref:C-glycoside deglycosidase beta subunit domain-containing protein n=1 Tax=Homoserinimonas sedimenticola TaxID=2986805 RepID=UPI002235CA0E|nr:DUF6379 domain-containing protein [Salinibacterium sedimenticola]MCW4385895.1 DUF6379 domain-containing protein [Salinibacterium sedimenticola]